MDFVDETAVQKVQKMELRSSSNKFGCISVSHNGGTNSIEIAKENIAWFEQYLDETRKHGNVLDEKVKALVAKRKSFERRMQHDLANAESKREPVSLPKPNQEEPTKKRGRGRPRKQKPASLKADIPSNTFSYPPSSDDDVDKKE